MPSAVQSPKAPLPSLPDAPESKRPAPAGVAGAPTVLEEPEAQKEKKSEAAEPGVFETLIVGLIQFIILLFTPLWNGIFGKKVNNEQ